jgi:hypothetical protein
VVVPKAAQAVGREGKAVGREGKAVGREGKAMDMATIMRPQRDSAPHGPVTAAGHKF